MPPLDDEVALFARFRALSTPSSLPVPAADQTSSGVDVLNDHNDQVEEDISDADVEAFLASLPADPPATLSAHSTSLRQYLQKPADSHDLLNTAKDLQAEASLYVDDRPGEGEDEAEEAEEDDPDYLNEDAIVQRAVKEAALEGDEDDEADQLIKKPLADGTAPQSSTDDAEDAFTKRLAALSSPPPLPRDPADEDEDPRTLSVLERLQGLSALQSAPTTKSNLPDNKIPSKFSAPGLSAERDDDIDSWCSMCNQDATVTCFGCDEEPYCTSCWKESHQDDMVPKHRVKPYVFKGGRNR